MLQLCGISTEAKPNSKYLMLALMKQCKIFRKRMVVQDLAPEQTAACQKQPLSAAARVGARAQHARHGPERNTEERSGQLLPSGKKSSRRCAPSGMPPRRSDAPGQVGPRQVVFRPLQAENGACLPSVPRPGETAPQECSGSPGTGSGAGTKVPG